MRLIFDYSYRNSPLHQVLSPDRYMHRGFRDKGVFEKSVNQKQADGNDTG